MHKSDLAVILAVLLSVVVGFSVYAEGESVSGPALEVSPVTKKLSLSPGDTKSDRITVKNNSEDPLSISIYAAPFTDGDENGGQDFETENKYTQITRWITIAQPSYVLSPHEQKDFSYQIKVPDSVASGGQYASIFVESGLKEGAIQTSSRIGVLLYATIKGDTIKSAQINSEDVDRIIIGDDVRLGATVINDGNIDFQAMMEMTISSVFGKTLYDDSLIATVFPENRKKLSLQWEDIPMYGLFHLTYNIRALDIDIEKDYYILVIPLWLLITIIIVFFGLIITIIYIVKRRRRRFSIKNTSIL